MGQIQIFYGNGKGKTTAAIGIAVRALGAGLSVHLVQFMKNDPGKTENRASSEIKFLEKSEKFSYKCFGRKSWYEKGKNDSEHKKSIDEAFQHLKNALNNPDFGMVIADEILYAVQFNLLDEREVIDLIKNKSENKDIILTGSHISLPKTFEIADLVTEIKKIKHSYDSGIKARIGIEY